MNEIDKLFGDLPSQDRTEADIFGDNPEPKAQPAAEAEPEEPRKNRRHRRLEEQYQQEREANIALTERIKVLSEQQQLRREFGAAEDVDPDLERVFGNTPEGKEIARIMAKREEQILSRAEERALERLQQTQAAEEAEVRKYESEIDSMLEEIEDSNGIDLSSDTPSARKARREFLDMVVRLSPKDSEGNISEYADFGSTFELWQSTRDRQPAPRNKELASRSMSRSAPAGTEDLQDRAHRDYLKSIGIRI